MRAVFIGASALAVMTARQLLEGDHEVVIVERDKERIDSLSEELDCGFLHGDGARPAILREADPEHTDFLFCLTGSDQANIIASLVGQSLGFGRVITQISNAELEHICLELGLEDTIIPSRTIASYLTDMAEERDPLEVSAMIRGDARVFAFVVESDQERPVTELDLPKEARVVCVYRGGKLLLPDEETRLKTDDEVILITHRDHIEALDERFKRLPRKGARNKLKRGGKKK
ncbi:MAG TPA: TrkA family potassium uptake protein [Pelomicrobium sp.]|nr:TrkA family potassium uptake protein [Pelomicrobium sp.]